MENLINASWNLFNKTNLRTIKNHIGAKMTFKWIKVLARARVSGEGPRRLEGQVDMTNGADIIVAGSGIKLRRNEL